MVHRPHAAEFVESLGADRGTAADRRLAQAVKEHTDGRGVDLVVDPIGGEAFDDAIRALATEGRLLVIGFAAGGIPTVKVNRLLLRNVGGHRGRIRRIRQPQPGSQSVFEFGVGRIGQGWAAATAAGALPAVEGRRRAAEPGRRRGARQGRAGAVMGPRALAFDVFGTVVDWRSSIIAELEEFGQRHGLQQDWPNFADDWRAGYAPAMDRVRRGELPWTRIDDLHRMILEELPWRGRHHVDLPRRTSTSSTAPGTGSTRGRTPCAGLTRLKERFIITTLSNGNMSLLTNMAKHAGLPWDCVISAELFHHYKPDPRGLSRLRRPARRGAG